MPELLQLTPQGHLVLTSDTTQVTAALEADPQLTKVLRAFEKSTAEGLITLSIETGSPVDPVLRFWKDFGSRFLRSLCRVAPTDQPLDTLERPSGDALALITMEAPPMRGIEYLRTGALEAIWDDLVTWTANAVMQSGHSLSDWLKRKAPRWHQLGRVCFHLAENKNDAEFPFAFMATYAPRLAQSGQVQFQALGNALREYAGAQKKAQLLQLLQPVYEASKRVPFVAELIETGDLYHPIAWTPGEAYAFLRSIPDLEACGLLTRLPNWWQSRQRATVTVSIGEKSKGGVGMGAMLSFRIHAALGDQKISPADLKALLQDSEGLVRLNGQWVEVDKERLEQALQHWKRVEEHAADGEISFAEGMRLMAGANRDLKLPSRDEAEADAAHQWYQVHAGAWLADTLARLRDPQGSGGEEALADLRGQLRPYQKTGYQWLRLLAQLELGACLADDMGLGKTIQIIALLLSRRRDFLQGGGAKALPSLLVLPASLLANWKAELETFAPSLRLLMVHPSEIDKLELNRIANDPDSALSECDVVLSTYGMLLRHDWLVEASWDLVVVDEAQAIKNADSQQTRTVKRLKARSRIALTGTPIENKLEDLWSIFDFACPGLLGTASAFNAFSKSLKDGKCGGYATLRKLIAPYILRRLKTDRNVVSDLPDKTELKAYCQLMPKQAALYQRAVDELRRSLNGAEGMQRRGLVLSFLMRFKQICNHPSQALGDHEYSPEASGKFSRLAELCEEIAQRQEKVLVFSQFREMTEPLAAYLAPIFGRSGLVLHGGTPVAQRQKLVESFQREKGPPFFVLSLKAGGSGLNLTAASHVIHFDRWWNPAVENQATDRAFRIGQRRNVLAHKFICRGTIEEKVDRLISEKLALSDSLLENGGEMNLTDLNDAELLDLVALDLQSAS